MGNVINLRSVKRARARTEAARTAAENRALHGRTAAEAARDSSVQARMDRELDGAKVTPRASVPVEDEAPA